MKTGETDMCSFVGDRKFSRHRKSQWRPDLAELYLYCMEEDDISEQWILLYLKVATPDWAKRADQRVNTVVSSAIGFQGTTIIIFMSSEKSWINRMSNDFSKCTISGEYFQSQFWFIIQISEERNILNLNLRKTYNWEVSRNLFAGTFYNVLNELQHCAYTASLVFHARKKCSWFNSFVLRKFYFFPSLI